MFEALIALGKAAFLEAVREKATEMTKEEAKALLEKLGVKVEEITDEALSKIEAAKSELDTETRRKVRAFWLSALVVCSIAAFAAGHYLF